jgi:hypothetical protein
VLLSLAVAWAGEEAATPPAAPGKEAAATPTSEPVKVSMGLFLLRIDALDLKSETATISFYVWTRWRGDIDGSAFEIINGTLDSKVSEYKETKDGEHYAYYRCRATVNIDVDFKRYPFDTHRLSIAMEHVELDVRQMVWEVDTASMKHLASPARSGWSISPPAFAVSETTYQTNWGLAGVSPDEATVTSRFTASIELRHEPRASFVKTFLPLFISMLITFLAFLISSEELEARVGIGVAGIFGAVTSQSLASDNLPETAYMTLSDQIHNASLFFVFATLLTSCYVGYLARTRREARAIKVDRTLGLCVTLGYVAVVSVLLAGF